MDENNMTQETINNEQAVTYNLEKKPTFKDKLEDKVHDALYFFFTHDKEILIGAGCLAAGVVGYKLGKKRIWNKYVVPKNMASMYMAIDKDHRMVIWDTARNAFGREYVCSYRTLKTEPRQVIHNMINTLKENDMWFDPAKTINNIQKVHEVVQ